MSYSISSSINSTGNCKIEEISNGKNKKGEVIWAFEVEYHLGNLTDVEISTENKNHYKLELNFKDKIRFNREIEASSKIMYSSFKNENRAIEAKKLLEQARDICIDYTTLFR